jgi:hypothetical protein
VFGLRSNAPIPWLKLHISDLLATVDLSRIDLDPEIVVRLVEQGFTLSDTSRSSTQAKPSSRRPPSPPPLPINELVNDEMLQSDEPVPSSDTHSRGSSPELGSSGYHNTPGRRSTSPPPVSRILERASIASSSRTILGSSRIAPNRMARIAPGGQNPKEGNVSRKRRKLGSGVEPQAVQVQERSTDLDSETEFPRRTNQMDAMRRLHFGSRN